CPSYFGILHKPRLCASVTPRLPAWSALHLILPAPHDGNISKNTTCLCYDSKNDVLRGGTMSARSANYKEILYSEEEVSQRIDELATDVIARYRGTKTIFVSLLNGAQPFTVKLMFAIQRLDPTFHPNVQSMIISHYGPNREPGEMRLVTDLPPEYRDLTGLRAVVLDDLIDRGKTLAYAAEHLCACGAESVESIVLVRKLKDPPVDSNVVLVGFDDVPDVWL